MAETAIARTARALDLIPYVIEHPGISIEELALAFGATKEQIVSDLNLLFICGLPGYSPLELIDLNFDDGFVSVIDPQVLDRPRTFTQGEVISLKLALSALSNFPGLSGEMQVKARSLNLRLSSILPENVTGLAEYLEVTQTQVSPNLHERLLTIHSALRSGSLLTFDYLSATSDLPSRREVIPQSLTLQGEWYYLQAYLPNISEDRTFRVDRISNLAVTKLSANGDIRSGESSAPQPMSEVKVRILPDGVRFLDDNSTIISHREELADSIEVTVSIFDEEWLIREVLSYGGSCEISWPQELAHEVGKRARLALSQYRQGA